MKKNFYAFLFLVPLCSAAQYTGTGSVTQGLATTTATNIYSCTGGRPTNVGTITATDNTVWTMPASVNFLNASYPFASVLHNSCTGVMYANSAAAVAALDGSDIVTIDAGGELITAYIFADNYFEMYVNGVFIGKDDVPFTQFNSNIVRFRVNRPFTIAMQLVDWEENLGLGSENNAGFAYHPGDGGIVVVFKDQNDATVAITNTDWKAQTFYTGPIQDLSCPTENGQQRLTTNCSTADSQDGTSYYALHWNKPSNWMSASYDDSGWPSAYAYANNVVGVNNKPAYTNFTNIFDDPAADASFIWSSNLILDNEVVVRYTVPASSSLKEGSQGCLKVYPNPATNELYLEMPQSQLESISHIGIFNALGEQMLETSSYQERLELKQLPAGIYTVQVNAGDQLFVQKLIIQ
jgi:hypothetical protein